MTRMNEMRGSNELIFGGPFSAHLSDEQKTEVEADKLVVVSKNGSVEKIPVNRVETIREMALGMYLEIVESQQTISGVDKVLREGGAIRLGDDIYWLKIETMVKKPTTNQKEEEPISIQELTEQAKKAWEED